MNLPSSNSSAAALVAVVAAGLASSFFFGSSFFFSCLSAFSAFFSSLSAPLPALGGWASSLAKSILPTIADTWDWACTVLNHLTKLGNWLNNLGANNFWNGSTKAQNTLISANVTWLAAKNVLCNKKQSNILKAFSVSFLASAKALGLEATTPITWYNLLQYQK